MPVAALAAILFLFAASCKDDVTPGTTTYPNYTQLKTGNYWIYEYYKVDSQGNSSMMPLYDSCYVSRDSVINGNTYYYVSGLYLSHINNRWLRDSLHYLVDDTGRICFSSMDYTTTFHEYADLLQPGDTIALISEKMAENNREYTVPAGTFNTSAFRMEYHFHPPYNIPGMQRYYYRRYAENIGLISETLPFLIGNEPYYMEKRLVRYHLN